MTGGIRGPGVMHEFPLTRSLLCFHGFAVQNLGRQTCLRSPEKWIEPVLDTKTGPGAAIMVAWYQTEPGTSEWERPKCPEFAISSNETSPDRCGGRMPQAKKRYGERGGSPFPRLSAEMAGVGSALKCTTKRQLAVHPCGRRKPLPGLPVRICLDTHMLIKVYEENGICVRNHCGAESPRDIEPPGLVTTVGGRDRASTPYAAADRVETSASAAGGRFCGVHRGCTTPSLPAEARTTPGARCLACSVPPVLVRAL